MTEPGKVEGVGKPIVGYTSVETAARHAANNTAASLSETFGKRREEQRIRDWEAAKGRLQKAGYYREGEEIA